MLSINKPGKNGNQVLNGECLLKIINKNKFHKNERKMNMIIVKNLIGLDHPMIVGLKYFSMSQNHFFYVES